VVRDWARRRRSGTRGGNDSNGQGRNVINPLLGGTADEGIRVLNVMLPASQDGEYCMIIRDEARRKDRDTAANKALHATLRPGEVREPRTQNTGI